MTVDDNGFGCKMPVLYLAGFIPPDVVVVGKLLGFSMNSFYCCIVVVFGLTKALIF